MKARFIHSSLVLLVLFSGYTISQSVSANEPIKLAQSVWKTFSSPDGGFSILMPGTPTEAKQTFQTKTGTVEVRIFTVEREQEQVNYTVGYADYPDDYIQTLKENNLVEQALDSGKNTALRVAKGTLIDEQKITLGNYSGREINYTKSGGKIVKYRIYLVDKRLYQVSVETTKNKQKYLTKSMAGFLNSFNLLPK